MFWFRADRGTFSDKNSLKLRDVDNILLKMVPYAHDVVKWFVEQKEGSAFTV